MWLAVLDLLYFSILFQDVRGWSRPSGLRKGLINPGFSRRDKSRTKTIDLKTKAIARITQIQKPALVLRRTLACLCLPGSLPGIFKRLVQRGAQTRQRRHASGHLLAVDEHRGR